MTVRKFYRIRFGVIRHEDSYDHGNRYLYYNKDFTTLLEVVDYVRKKQPDFFDGPTIFELYLVEEKFTELKKEDVPDLSFHTNWW